MKPFHTLLFLIVTFALLTGLMFIFPANGIKLTDEYTLQFETFDDFWSADKNELKDISSIIETTTVDLDTIEFTEMKSQCDSVS